MVFHLLYSNLCMFLSSHDREHICPVLLLLAHHLELEIRYRGFSYLLLVLEFLEFDPHVTFQISDFSEALVKGLLHSFEGMNHCAMLVAVP